MHRMSIQTNQQKQVIDLTSKINTFVGQQDFGEGVCHIFVLHTTAALSTADLDPGTDLDMLDAYTAMIPQLEFRHPHNPEHAPDHILATLIGPSVTIPVERGRLVLGTWQRVVLFEFDGPREREIVVSLIT